MAHGTRAFLPHMINQGGGAIVNVSSILGICAFPTQSAYCAAKFAARGYTEAVRQELHGTGVRAITVHLGGVATPITRSGRVKVNRSGAATSIAFTRTSTTSRRHRRSERRRSFIAVWLRAKPESLSAPTRDSLMRARR